MYLLKGQLISKANCQAVNSSLLLKKEQMYSFLLLCDVLWFVFWKKFKTPKRHYLTFSLDAQTVLKWFKRRPCTFGQSFWYTICPFNFSFFCSTKFFFSRPKKLEIDRTIGIPKRLTKSTWTPLQNEIKHLQFISLWLFRILPKWPPPKQRRPPPIKAKIEVTKRPFQGPFQTTASPTRSPPNLIRTLPTRPSPSNIRTPPLRHSDPKFWNSIWKWFLS